MRQTTVNGITITYPEDIIWVHDHSAVTVSGNGPTGATLTIYHPAGATKVLTYMSPLSEVTFYLDTALRLLENDNIGDYRCDISLFQNYSFVGNFSFWFKLYKGKSFQDRTHGTSQHIYIYDPSELTKINIFSPSSGTATILGHTFNIERGLNSLNLTQYITEAGEYNVCLTDSEHMAINAFIISDTAVSPSETTLEFSVSEDMSNADIGGNIFGNMSIFPICHTIEMSDACQNYPFVELVYIDTDGCRRYLGGTVINDTESVSKTAYTRLNEEIYKDVPRGTLTDANNLLKVQFSDIDVTSNFRDILYSEELYLRRKWDGELIPVRIKTDSLVLKSNEDYVDFELEIYYQD